jgi:hypothetical protein
MRVNGRICTDPLQPSRPPLLFTNLAGHRPVESLGTANAGICDLTTHARY